MRRSSSWTLTLLVGRCGTLDINAEVSGGQGTGTDRLHRERRQPRRVEPHIASCWGWGTVVTFDMGLPERRRGSSEGFHAQSGIAGEGSRRTPRSAVPIPHSRVLAAGVARHSGSGPSW